MASNVGCTFGVGDTTQAVYKFVSSKTNRMVTLNTMFMVVS